MSEIVKQPLIVCVDDEASVLALMERALTKSGFRVAGSLGGTAAISLIQKCKPDLILMDIKMPEISGPDMCVRLKKSKGVAKIPVIFVTGLNGENEQAEAFSAGAVEVLHKPFDLDVLVQTAHKTLQAKSN